ncbi:hypothetical protein EST38_g2590 [Candolleomyces aberdarensis]|uniref:Uncharacterized protein n=1 Tax=Candolleomyces aberdarensis TaxID=2316362 RepID=A0A4Q2DT49_9AGAR|nr:hypothetical protein EST38_g2590 [Candolleomyces aberdarensis]
MQAIINKLSSFERATINSDETHSAYRRFLYGDPSIAVRTRMSTLSELNPERSTRLISTLFDYRFLDVALAQIYGFDSRGQPERLSIPVPPKIFFKSASHWPNMILKGLRSLRECEKGDIGALLTVPDIGDPTTSIFTSLVHRKDVIEGHKIMSNFECTTAYLSLLLKGITDLPNTVPEFKDLVMNMCHGSNLSDDAWEKFFDSMKSVHSFKLPLQFSLTTSPACLFLPSAFMTKDLNRILLVQVIPLLASHVYTHAELVIA